MDNLYNDDDRQYLLMMQENIARLANNSANCKTWMLTIVAGILAINCEVEKLADWIIFIIVPIVVFWYLDAFYLSLERGMRNRQRDFLNKISNCCETDYRKALYKFAPLEQDKNDSGKGMVSTKMVATTKSVMFFYLPLLLVAILVAIILNFSFIQEVINNL